MNERPHAAWESAARLFSTLSVETRLSILQELRDGPRHILEMAAALETTPENVAEQLQVLHHANLLNREERGAQVYYSIKDETALQLCEIAAIMVESGGDHPRDWQSDGD